MENNYGIAVKNKFSLFLDDDCDPFEILRSQEEEKLKTKTDKSKKDAKNEAKAAKSVKNKAAKKPATPIQDQPKTVDVNANKKEGFSGEQKPRGGRGRGGQMDGGDRTGSALRGNREGGFGNREFDRPPRRERVDRERGEGRGDRPPMEFRDRGDRPESGRGRGRGERGGRGRGRGARGGGFGGPKREFERHSGSDKTGFGSSGIKPMEKREGGGAHNWGTMKDDMEGKEKASEQLNESVENETVETPEGNENQNPNTDPVEEETPVEEEGPKEMTLDEWRAQQNQGRTSSSFNIRKPGEGVNNDQWKKTYLLKKKIEKTESDEEEDSDEEEEDTRQKKNLLNIEITFNDQPTRGRGGRRGRGGGDRGGRGRGDDRGGRGGRGRGGDRGDRGDRTPGGRGGGFGGPRGGGRGGDRGGEDRGERGDRGGSRREAAPHIEDENDFPSLGGK